MSGPTRFLPHSLASESAGLRKSYGGQLVQSLVGENRRPSAVVVGGSSPTTSSRRHTELIGAADGSVQRGQQLRSDEELYAL